jgi:hypothetical protein
LTIQIIGPLLNQARGSMEELEENPEDELSHLALQDLFDMSGVGPYSQPNFSLGPFVYESEGDDADQLQSDLDVQFTHSLSFAGEERADQNARSSAEHEHEEALSDVGAFSLFPVLLITVTAGFRS